MKKRLACILIVLALVLLASGCTGSSTNNSDSKQKLKPGPAASSSKIEVQPNPLELIESGYTVVEGPFVEYGFVLRNPNESYAAQFPSVRITMRDAGGAVLGTDEQTLNRIMPGEIIGWGGQANPNGKKPDKVEFEIIDPGDNWKPGDQMEPAEFKTFGINGLNVNKSDFSTSFTGELVNPNNTAFDQVAISVLLRNQDGKIVVGYSGFAEKLAANGKVPFEVNSLGALPEYSKFEAYAQPW